jgi:hypothetical protein
MLHGRRGSALFLALAAIPLGAALLACCADPAPRPEGSALILAAWEERDEAGSRAMITIRIACSGELGTERFGATVRADTEKRRYWASIEEEAFLPAGASTTRSLELPFAEAGEALVPGSAAVESSWFE